MNLKKKKKDCDAVGRLEGWDGCRWLQKRETSTGRKMREPGKGIEEIKGKPQMSRDSLFSD